MNIIKKTLYIIGAIFTTLLGLCLVWVLAIRLSISIDSIKSATKVSGYNNIIEMKIREEFSDYIGNEQIQELLSKIPIKDNIYYILSGIQDDTVEVRAENVQHEVYNVIYRNLKDKTSKESIDIFSKTMSEKYVKTLLPISYFAKYSKIYIKYEEKLNMIIVVISIMVVILFIVLSYNKRSFKYVIVALCDIVIISIYIMVVLLSNKSLALGNVRLVIEQVVESITIKVGLELLLIIAIIIYMNYVKYLKKSTNN